jgi:membrane-associated phospholipid phosphatase
MLNRFLTPADKWRLGIIAFSELIFLIAWSLSMITVEWASFVGVYIFVGLLAAIGLTYRGLNRGERIAAAFFVTGQVILDGNVVAMNNYLGLELPRPLNDEFLAGIDRALGLDWWSYVTWVKSDPFFGRVLTYAYISSLGQLGVAIQLLAMTRQFARLDRLTLALMIAGTITLAIWVPFPSLGALPLHYALGLPDPVFDLAMSKNEAMGQLALHAGPLPPLRIEDLSGYVGFPSFHAVMAILTVHALWGLPVTGLLALAINSLVLLSIPADGGHHFIDVAGGAAVALVSLVITNAILRRTTFEQKKGSSIVSH